MMNRHIKNLISAYMDGELSPRQQLQIDEHLESCAECRQAVEQEQSLSSLLAAWPAPPARTSPAVFTSQVRLRLPRTPFEPSWRRHLRTAWRYAPLGLAAIWAFGQAALLVLTFAWAAQLNLPVELGGGVFGLLSPWMEGILPGWELLAAGLNGLTLSLGLSLVAAGLFMGWFASQWIAHKNNSLGG
jgi:anti-sigma factor RsiW